MKKKTSPSPLKKSKKRDIVDKIIDDVMIPDIDDAGDVPDDIVLRKYEAVITPIVEVGVAVDSKPKKIRKKSKASVREHYVNSKEFEERIRVYYTTGEINSDLADSLNKIANGLSFAPNFINYSYKEDMVGDAIVKMFSALKNKKFRLDSGFSPFSYFTTIAFHAFINRIKKEKKYHEALTEYKEKTYADSMQAGEGAGHIYVEPSHDNGSGDDIPDYN